MTGEITICGGSGFIGQHLLASLARDPAGNVRYLVHRHDPAVHLKASHFTAVKGDLLDPDSLTALVTPGCTVVNLAYMPARTPGENLDAAENLASACRRGGARRLVHVSTAVVAGAASDDVITEVTPPDPRDPYERTKLEIEQRLRNEARGGLELVILRPTAVFGPAGANLVKLADGLLGGSVIANYARACFHGRRKMNLVCVENVVAAIRFAVSALGRNDAETFIVSDDDNDLNDYRGVESTLRKAFGLSTYPVRPVPLPGWVLGLALGARGRSNTNPQRVYSGAKLAAAGFLRPVTLESGLVSFAEWYRSGRR
jgi:nucleoside-diphosphate-sugar epimerase